MDEGTNQMIQMPIPHYEFVAAQLEDARMRWGLINLLSRIVDVPADDRDEFRDNLIELVDEWLADADATNDTIAKKILRECEFDVEEHDDHTPPQREIPNRIFLSHNEQRARLHDLHTSMRNTLACLMDDVRPPPPRRHSNWLRVAMDSYHRRRPGFRLSKGGEEGADPTTIRAGYNMIFEEEKNSFLFLLQSEYWLRRQQDPITLDWGNWVITACDPDD